MKAALDYVGLTGGPVRPQFKELTQAERDEVYRPLHAAGVPQLIGRTGCCPRGRRRTWRSKSRSR